MPIEMNWTFQGVNYPESWWVVGSLNISVADKAATVIMRGFVDKAGHDADSANILDTRLFVCNDPDVFDSVFGQVNKVNIVEAFVTVVEGWLINTESSGFFSTGIQWSPVSFHSAEIGAVASNVVSVQFTDDVFNGGLGISSGAVIKVNGSTATISSASQPADLSIINYVLSAPVDADDVITYENTSRLALVDGAGNGLHRTAENAVTNTVGGYWRFNEASNSGHLILAF